MQSMIEQYDAAIKEYLQLHRHKIVESLAELVKIPSITGSEAADKALLACGKLLEQKGFSVKTDLPSGYLIGEKEKTRQREKTIGLFSHCDVVPVQEDDWNITKPFEMKIVGNCITGRGVRDDKGGFIQCLTAALILQELKIPLRSHLQLIVGNSEEVSGMQDMIRYSKQEKQPELCFVADSGFPASLGEKGIVRFWVKFKEKFVQLRSIQGGVGINVVPNYEKAIIAWNADLWEELEEKLDREWMKLWREKNEIFLEVRGISAHAAAPQNSVSAMKKMCDILCNCSSLAEQDRRILQTLQETQQDYCGTFADIQMEDVSGSLTCVLGLTETQDGYIRCSYDIRTGVTICYEQAEQKLRSYFEKHGFAVEKYDARPGFYLGRSRLSDSLEEMYHALGQKGDCFISAGGTYSRVLKNSYSIGTSAKSGTEPSVILSGGRGSAHQSDETVCIDDMLEGIRILVYYILTADHEINV